MNNLIDNSDDEAFSGQRDREITLGTMTILGIFFALAVLCAAFFGFGYSMGSKHNAVATVAAEPTANALGNATFNGFKPAAGSAAGKLPQPKETVTVPVNQSPVTPTANARAGGPQANPSDKPFVESTAAEEATARAVSRTVPPATGAATSTPPATLAGTATLPSVVQIAAVTHQEDAELIASTLKRRGYSVNIRQEPQDKLLHIQVGPFANKKDAEAMRQRLLADGFNAYIK